MFADKEFFMRGRMPFPDPFLHFAIAAMIVGLIVPTCLQLTQKLKMQYVPNENSTKTESGTNVIQEGITVPHQDSKREHWDSRIDPPKGWGAVDRPLADYVIAYPGRPIIVSFGAKWTMSSTFGWRMMSTDGVTEALQDAGFVCLAADLTGGNELATKEMRRFGRVALPVTAVFDPTTRKWEPKNEFFSTEDVLEWATLLKARIAEQPADAMTPESTHPPH